MHITHALPGLLVALVFASGAGCKKSESAVSSAPPVPTVLSPDTVARVHWLGKKRLGSEATAYYLMRLWGLPETAKLEAQTLDKLSTAPWRLFRGETNAANPAGALLRPLLDDIVQEECYLEVRHATNQPVELAFAIRLGDQHADLWKTNLAIVVASLTGVQTMFLQTGGHAWSIRKQDAPNHVELKRVGEWTVVGAGQEENALLGELVARIRRGHAPFAARATNYWLEADLDLPQVAGTLWHAWNLPGDLPRLSVRVTGDGGNVLTFGDLTFPKSLQVELDSWTIPTDLIHEPLAGFTAIRGVKPWLASWKIWNDFQIGPPPNQFYFWSMDGVPIQTCFAAPLPDAGNQVQGLTGILLRDGNPWLGLHGMGSFGRSPDTNGVTWGGLPLVSPFVKSVDAAGGSFVFGGLLPNAVSETNRPPSPEVIHDVLRRTNLVYYDWEATGPRIDSWFAISQVARVASRHAQLPLELASIAWLKVISTRLDKCATSVTGTETNQLSFVRKSTAGLTAPELHLLADWLESPQFPRGLYSFLTAPAAPPVAPAKP